MTEMKRCGECREERPLAAFSKNRSTKDGLQHRCKACFSEWHKANRERQLASMKAWKAANPDKVVANHAIHNRARRAENRARLIELKLTLSCVDCGWKPTTAEETSRLEFDHKDPFTKHRARTSSAFGGCWAWERIEGEIALCDPRCRECHRERTTREGHRLIRKNRDRD